MINSSWGLGESIVSGTVTPDTYIVDRSSRTIKQRNTSSKEMMTVCIAAGTEEVVVPGLMRELDSISDGQILELCSLALDLESHFGWPVDIECAFREDTLYLLQCRPITTV